ncbi:hypothetical protein [Burkholderia ambifaria]|uniref:hypothetical protein n=1 Tax=Burkholderia ambifaria TaxID=152480 RepID=UPI00158AE211|nr:hypothetical protein [Burkholderia ambifaria]MBR8346579.1 hypothetical protein [Burkholderia ambifaria]
MAFSLEMQAPGLRAGTRYNCGLFAILPMPLRLPKAGLMPPPADVTANADAT